MSVPVWSIYITPDGGYIVSDTITSFDLDQAKLDAVLAIIWPSLRADQRTATRELLRLEKDPV